MEKGLLRKREIATRLNVSLACISRWMKAGRVRFFKLGEGARAPVRFPASEIERLLKPGLTSGQGDKNEKSKTEESSRREA